MTGSGPAGTIVERDIREAAARRPAPGPAALSDGETTRFTLKPLTAVRRAIARRMTASARDVPQFVLSVDVDAGGLLDYRRKYGLRIEAAARAALTLTDLVLWLTARALARYPGLNASYTPEGIQEWADVHLGLAVATDDGLVVPVIRDAARRTLAELTAARAELVGRARRGALRPEDVHGGTFTVSNLGPFGVDAFTALLDPPQAGILSVGAVRERPAVVDGGLAIRPLMTLGLTVDHRVTDGAGGARFLRELRRLTESGLEETPK